MNNQAIHVVGAVFRRWRGSDLQLLFFRRSKTNSGAGFWEFPGGKIESGESANQALVREIQEELGVSIKVQGFLAENEHSFPNKKILLKLYLAELLENNFLPPLKIYEFYQEDNLKNVLLFAVTEILSRDNLNNAAKILSE